jgi:glycosyltransferase involved in cell wall biosynthesis
MSSSLRILIDARMVTENTHGIGRYTFNLIRGLNQAGHQVSILSHSPQTPNIIGPNKIQGIIPARFAFATPMESIELSFLVRRKNYDVIHFPSFSVPIQMPKNSVVTIHDLIHLYPPSKWTHQLYYEKLAKRSLLKAARIISVSEWTKNDLKTKLEIPFEKVDVIRNGLEEKWFQPPDSKRSSSPPVPYFLCLSNPKAHKNVKTLILACQQLWKHGHVFSLVLSLGGSDLSPDWYLPNEHREKIKLVKNLADDDLFSYFAHARAVVSPSFYEGYDYPAAEGLAMNRPVILSNNSAHSELKGRKIHFYSPADNVPALAASLVKCLTIQDDEMPSEHNISSLETMVKETVETYSKALTAN